MIASTQNNSTLAPARSSGSPHTPLEIACARLKSAGLRITQPRIAILEALIRRSLPASIEQIHLDLSNSACDLVTVYRCLAAFEDLGLVRRCFFHNGTSLYQINLSGETTYHVVNKTENTVEELPVELANELRDALHAVEKKLVGLGYVDVSHMVEFFGRSPAAAEAAAGKKEPALAAT